MAFKCLWCTITWSIHLLLPEHIGSAWHKGMWQSKREKKACCCSVSQSDSLWPHGLQHASFPVLNHLPELAQAHVHWVGDAIQPSYLLSSPSPPAFNLSQHQGLFKWISSSHQMAKVLEFQFQHQSFQWIFRTDFLSHVWLFVTPWTVARQDSLSFIISWVDSNSCLLCWCCHSTERCLLSHERRWDSWLPEERNSIQSHWQGLITQSFCVIKFY